MKLTRKELAALIGELRDDPVTVDQLRKNELAWGLKPSRGKDLTKRCVRYDRDKALDALRKSGIVPEV